jgi:pullulanase
VYQNAAAEKVEVNGEWNRWAKPFPLNREGDRWRVDLAARKLPAGRHEYKFIVDGEYEPGGNRQLFINADGQMERRPDWIISARMEAPRRAEIRLKRPIPPTAQLRARLEPGPEVARIELPPARDDRALSGHAVWGESVTFTLDPAAYGLRLNAGDRVSVAGTFNRWSPGATGWTLADADGDGRWELEKPLADLRATAGPDAPLLFKFVINRERWLEPPAAAPNATREGGDGAVNLRVDPAPAEDGPLVVHTVGNFDLTRETTLVLEGLAPAPLRHPLSPGVWLDTFVSRLPMGVIPEGTATVFRTYAPRASAVTLRLFDGPEPKSRPREQHALTRAPDGSWSVRRPGSATGLYYHYTFAGPGGDAEGFDSSAAVGDWYARAAAQAHRNNRVVDPAATNAWFSGWTDGDFVAAPWENALIYETHVRHFTADPSSGVPRELRGTFAGFAAGEKGLDHLKALGVNYIQLMPVAEYANGDGKPDWGYSPCFYFAPEASYGREPLAGSAYYEFKQLVNDLHRRGFGVILDVVYNHVGDPNVFHYMDKKAFFRMGPDFAMSNFSGCGNDARTEHPMFRRMIVENVLYWMREFHIDGFRFDLAELIDAETLAEVERQARALNPRVLLISEPWSFRGNHKSSLTGTGWSAWNDDFRESAKRFVQGKGGRSDLMKTVAGSRLLWAAHPLQTVNYVESHDDRALADELSLRDDHDGRNPTPESASVNRMAATLVFTSLGIPMLSEGQEFLRSKHGVRNTYKHGDAFNAIRFTDRERPLAKETLDYVTALSALRHSPEGASLRLRAAPPLGYYEFTTPGDERLLAYQVNARGQKPGAAFLVLLNASPDAAALTLEPAPGTWERIGDGRRLDPAQPSRRATGGVSTRFTVPGRMAEVWWRSQPP